jgi:hypothetical protein
MKALKKILLADEGLFKAIIEAETETEKLLLVLAQIHNNTKSIKAWISFYGVLTIIGMIAWFLIF